MREKEDGDRPYGKRLTWGILFKFAQAQGLCPVLCCVSNTWHNAWHIVGAQLRVLKCTITERK